MEAIDPPRADDPDVVSFIYADEKLYEALLKNDFTKYLEMVTEKKMKYFNIEKKVEVKEEEIKEDKIDVKEDKNKYKRTYIQGIMEGLNNLENTLNQFKK